MPHPQLVKSIYLKLSEGKTREAIVQELLPNGFSQMDIEAAFVECLRPHQPSLLSRLFHSRISTGLVAVFIFLILPIITCGAYLMGTKTLSYSFTLPPVPTNEKVNPITYGEQEALSNPDFFQKVKQRFIDEQATFVEADLTTKILRVYKNGTLSIEVPIDTQGKEGSWWETPAGLYKIASKEKEHFSGMGHVWMPWSMNFQGNFYIHGRTYYPDGTLTSAAYTGGCIRLSTENAKKVYDAVEVGTPLLVFEHSFETDNFMYGNTITTPLDAVSYLSADLKNNHVFSSRDATTVVPIASITKLMTALITTEYINLENKTKIPESAIVFTSRPRLKTGEVYSIYQLLFPLLRESSNEAAEAIARYYGRENFIKHMNTKAASIGMTHTKFVDPSGQGAENLSTAEDLFMLAKYIYNNRSFIFKITSGKITQSAYGDTGFTNLGNFNDNITHKYFFGGKNGKTTAAQETSLTVLEVPVGRSTRPIVSLVLGSQNARENSQKLIEATLAQVPSVN